MDLSFDILSRGSMLCALSYRGVNPADQESLLPKTNCLDSLV